MTIPEFFQNYRFNHHCSFYHMRYDEKNKLLTLFCYFRDLRKYTAPDSRPADCELAVTFRNAEFSGLFSECSVLGEKLLDSRTLYFYLERQNTNDFFEFVISADSAEVQTIYDFSELIKTIRQMNCIPDVLSDNHQIIDFDMNGCSLVSKEILIEILECLPAMNKQFQILPDLLYHFYLNGVTIHAPDKIELWYVTDEANAQNTQIFCKINHNWVLQIS